MKVILTTISTITITILTYSTLYCLVCVNSGDNNSHSSNTTCPDPIAYDLATVKYVMLETFNSVRCGVAIIIVSILEILNGVK